MKNKTRNIIIICAVVVAALLVIGFIVFTFIGFKATNSQTMDSQREESVSTSEVQSIGQTDVIVADSSMMDTTAYEGKWFTVCGLFDMYLPNNWVEDTLTDEQKATNIGCSIHDPESECYMQVRFYDAEDLDGGDTSNLDAIVSTLKDAGYSDANKWLLNGIYCVVYTDSANDCLNIWIPAADGELVTVLFTNQSNEDYQNTISNMFLSITPMEDSSDDTSK